MNPISPVHFGDLYRIKWVDMQKDTPLASEPDTWHMRLQLEQTLSEAGIQGDIEYLGRGHGFFDRSATHYLVTNGPRDNTYDRVQAIKNLIRPDKTALPETLKQLADESVAESEMNDMTGVLDQVDAEVEIRYEYSHMTGGKYLRNGDAIVAQLRKDVENYSEW